jgi:type IV pilus assembly protein PilW
MNATRRSVGRTSRRAPRFMRPQRGLTLVELIISLSLGLLLIAAVGAVYVGSSQTYRAGQDAARIQEAGRYALDVMGRSLRAAGYATAGFTGSLTAIDGTNGADGAPDVVTTQRAWVTGDRSCDGDSVVPGGQLKPVVQDSFSLDTANQELECAGVILDAPGAPGTAQPLLDGAEDLQLLYGRDTDTPKDGAANIYTEVPANTDEWDEVVSVRVCVLIRSGEGAVTSAQTYLNCAGALGTAANDAARFTTATDTRLRRTFVDTFALRNRILTIP